MTKADPDDVSDVAVTVTVDGVGATAGAVYSPLSSTVPFPLPPVTAQVTLWFEENRCCVTPVGQELPATFANTVANPGVTVTGGGVVPPPATPPQEIKFTNASPKQPATIVPQSPVIRRFFRPIPAIPPTTTQATARDAKQGAWLARALNGPKAVRLEGAAEFGPVVKIVQVTVLVPVPAAP